MQTIQVFRLAATVARSYVAARCAGHWVKRTYHARKGQRAVWALLGELKRCERGSIRLTLLAFQLAMAVGIGSAVLSILERAQAALGGVL